MSRLSTEYPLHGFGQVERTPLLRELSIDGPVYQVARHEIMHGLINPDNVIAISARPKGRALGWTLLRHVDNVSLAAGIYHGEGFGSDKFRIELDALQNGYSPEWAVGLAVSEAGRILSPQEKIIDLMARELAIRGTMSGDEFIDLLGRARRELADAESPFDWSWPKEEEEKNETIDLSDNDPYIHIPKEGKFELTIYTENGYKVEIFENGKRIKTEVYVQTNKDKSDEEPKYEKVAVFHDELFTRLTSRVIYVYNN